MEGDDLAEEFGGAVQGRFAFVVEDGVVVFAGEIAIFFPPAADGGGVVGAGGADAEVGVLGYVGEVDAGLFGHPLDFKGEDAKLAHGFRDCGGDHAEVFAAGEHAGSVKEGRELAECRLFPELLVAAEEVFFV